MYFFITRVTMTTCTEFMNSSRINIKVKDEGENSLSIELGKEFFRVNKHYCLSMKSNEVSLPTSSVCVAGCFVSFR